MVVTAKPQLRGLLATLVKRNLTISVIVSCAAGFGWYYGVAVPRKNRYAEFYK